MITYSFINLKGGVGKTTISINTAYILASAGAKVLFIDNDKQGNASYFFNAKDKEITLADVFLNPDLDIQKAIYPARKIQEGLIDILPSNMTLLPLNMKHTEIDAEDKTFILKNALKAVEDKYDFCIIDNAPDINFTVYNALIATNQVIIVTNPDDYANSGLNEMDIQFQNVLKDRQLYDESYNEHDPQNNFILRGALMNKYITNTYSKAQSKYKFFKTNINLINNYASNKRLFEAINLRKSMIELSPRSLFARQMNKFVDELLYDE